MTNRDFIESYKSDKKIIADYYKFKDGAEKKDITGIVNPLHIDNRQLVSPIDNQTVTPHCAAYSAATLVESLYWKKTGKLLQLDSHQIYALAKTLDGEINSEGTYLEYALKSVLQLCLADERFQFLKNAKIETFFNEGSQYSVESVKRLVHKYGIIQAGFNIDQGWTQCNARNYVIRPAGVSLGGHAVLICGYDYDGFYIVNQWGTEWGAKGFAVMPFDVFRRQLMYCAYLENAEV